VVYKLWRSDQLDNWANGMAVNFPPSLSRYWEVGYRDIDYQNIGLDFCSDSHWDEMLLKYYQYESEDLQKNLIKNYENILTVRNI